MSIISSITISVIHLLNQKLLAQMEM